MCKFGTVAWPVQCVTHDSCASPAMSGEGGRARCACGGLQGVCDPDRHRGCVTDSRPIRLQTIHAAGARMVFGPKRAAPPFTHAPRGAVFSLLSFFASHPATRQPPGWEVRLSDSEDSENDQKRSANAMTHPPVDSMRDAVLQVSPNRCQRGFL